MYSITLPRGGKRVFNESSRKTSRSPAERSVHIVSASRRTDIPAFHSNWFMNRARQGSVLVRSPFGGRSQVVSLTKSDVIAFVFWTKNAVPLIPRLTELKDMGHCASFLYTVNNYPPALEPRVPRLSHTMRALERLARVIPPGGVRWRYDTIVLTDSCDRAWHVKNFTKLCRLIGPFSIDCIFSFCDYYKKTLKNMARFSPDHHIPQQDESRDMTRELAMIAADANITLLSCSHDFLISSSVGKASCIDSERIAPLLDSDERRDALRNTAPRPSRSECGCVASKDIGAYDTCGHGCVYCYANANPERALENLRLIDPDAPSLDPKHGASTPRADLAL